MPTVNEAERMRRSIMEMLDTANMTAEPLHLGGGAAPTGALPAHTEAAVKELHSLLAQEVESWEPGARSQAEAHMDGLTLARFVSNASSGPGAARDSFRKAMEFRAARHSGQLWRELNVATLCSAAARGEASERQRVALAHGYAGLGGIAKDGTPFFVERLGRADFGGYESHEPLLELMTETYLAQLELIHRTVRACSAACGKLTYGLVVVDCSGLGLSLLRHTKLLTFAAKVRLTAPAVPMGPIPPYAAQPRCPPPLFSDGDDGVPRGNGSHPRWQRAACGCSAVEGTRARVDACAVIPLQPRQPSLACGSSRASVAPARTGRRTDDPRKRAEEGLDFRRSGNS